MWRFIFLCSILLTTGPWLTIPVSASDQRWSDLGPSDGGTILSLTVDPRGPSLLFAGTGAGIYRSTEGGARWQSASDGLESFAIHRVVFDPEDSQVVYAATGGGIFRSRNGGDRWHKVLEGVSGSTGWRLLVDPSDGRRLWAGAGATLYVTSDDGDTWRQLSGLAPGECLFLEALAIDPGSPTTLYAGASGPAVFSCTRGIFRSRDGGESWSRIFDPVIDVFSLAVHPTTEGTLFAGTGFGISKSSDGGTSWIEVVFPTGIVRDLSFDPFDADVMYAATEDTGLHKSVDGWATWARADDGLVIRADNGTAGSRVLAVVPDPVTPRVVWAGTSHGSFVFSRSVVGGVYRSPDGGASWARRATGINSTSIRSTAASAGGRASFGPSMAETAGAAPTSTSASSRWRSTRAARRSFLPAAMGASTGPKSAARPGRGSSNYRDRFSPSLSRPPIHEWSTPREILR